MKNFKVLMLSVLLLYVNGATAAVAVCEVKSFQIGGGSPSQVPVSIITGAPSDVVQKINFDGLLLSAAYNDGQSLKDYGIIKAPSFSMMIGDTSAHVESWVPGTTLELQNRLTKFICKFQ